jgi:hypothetical protein
MKYDEVIEVKPVTKRKNIGLTTFPIVAVE